MKILLLLLTSVFAISQVLTGGWDFSSVEKDALEFVSGRNVSKVDFSTNKTDAKVYFQLVTNEVIFNPGPTSFHAVYPACGCDGCSGRKWVESKKTFLIRYAELEGQRIQLSSELIAKTNRYFLPLISTNRNYIQ